MILILNTMNELTILAGRPGTCPKIVDAVGGVCIDECASDYSCPVGQKCCSNGCGRVCTKAIGGGITFKKDIQYSKFYYLSLKTET